MTDDGDIAPKGDCYEANIRFFRDHVDDEETADWTICHGTVTNAAGDSIGHCWLESLGFAYDFSNGNRFRLPVETYYELTRAREVIRYSSEDVAVNIIRHGHYGPWR